MIRVYYVVEGRENMKKKFATILALAMTMNIGIMNSFAAEEPAWILPKDISKEELHSRYGQNVSYWWEAEAHEQAKAWAEAHKGNIPSIADEKARYEAVAKTVVDFLDYDDIYQEPHIAYSVRDGKGVCSDYHTLGMALCQACNIPVKVASVGQIATGLNHDMLVVTINGTDYYSDLTGVETGVYPLLMTSIPKEYTFSGYMSSSLLGEATEAGDATDGNSYHIKQIEAHSKGKVYVSSADGGQEISEELHKQILDAINRDDWDTVNRLAAQNK